MVRLRGFVQERRRLLREGLALWIDAQPDLELAGVACTGPELLVACAADAPDFVVFEADGDGADWDPTETGRALRRAHPRARLVATVEDLAEAACLAEVCAVVPRAGGVAVVIDAVRGRPGELRPVPSPTNTDQLHLTTLLTRRELDILRLIGAGLSGPEIAARLGISRKTVDSHKQRMFTKLGVQSQAHAVAVAVRTGFLAGTAPTQ